MTYDITDRDTTGSVTTGRVTALISEIAGIPETDLHPAKQLTADLDIDSLTKIELAIAIQDEFDLDVPDDTLKELETVQDIINLICTAPLTTT